MISLPTSPALSSKLEKRKRPKGSSVQGALSAAVALGCRQIFGESKQDPTRSLSPIHSKKLLGLGEGCGVQFGSAVVRVEPSSPAAFWDIARRAMAEEAGAQTLEIMRACSACFSGAQA
jgi:hypothetical protein